LVVRIVAGPVVLRRAEHGTPGLLEGVNDGNIRPIYETERR
jgi:hypothetical protein